MANELIPISGLPEGTTLADDDLLVYVDNSGTPTTKKITEVNAGTFLGTSGYSGFSGRSGYSGFSGANPGASGYSGYSGSGVSGYSGFSGVGTSGYSGYSGVSGYSGYSGPSGYSGYSGLDGVASASGYSGFTGVSGYSGFSGTAFATLTAAPGSDDTYSGIILSGLNNSGGVTQWDAVYLNGSSAWVLADANGSGTYPARGLAIATVAGAGATSILTYGTVRNDAWSWTIAGPIYLSATPGGLTQTPPATSGDQVQVVGYALTADVAFFDFNSTYLTVA